MAERFTGLQSAQASAERLQALLDTAPTIVDSAEVRRDILLQKRWPRPELASDGKPHGIREIEFENVDFAYQGSSPILRDFNLTIHAGESIALVGETGSGKSTVARLVCRFYEPTRGRILLDGVDYRERSLDWLQSNLGIVLQEPHLFSGTIRENIRYGRLQASDAEIEAVARQVGAAEFISQLPKGYDTEVGEGGNRLSTGQKQFVSLARALLADPQILFSTKQPRRWIQKRNAGYRAESKRCCADASASSSLTGFQRSDRWIESLSSVEDVSSRKAATETSWHWEASTRRSILFSFVARLNP
jgi:ATP-binding cassette subfamily B protein